MGPELSKSVGDDQDDAASGEEETSESSESTDSSDHGERGFYIEVGHGVERGLIMRGVELDDGRSMEEVYGNVEKFYDKLVKAAGCASVRPYDEKWSSKIRFLTPYDGPRVLKEAPPPRMHNCGEVRNTPIAPPEPAAPCCNLRGYRSFTGSETRRLRLTDFGEIPTCPHFVAVSYVWSNWPKETEGDEYEIFSSTACPGPSRPNRASSRLIGWAMDYAAYWGMPFIWLDQECIEQSDREEKQAHIDDMDRTFRRAAKVIAPLSTNISRRRQLQIADFLLNLEEGICSSDLDRAKEDTMRALGNRLFRDDWFTRAWTLQENISATRADEVDMLVSIDIVPHHARFAAYLATDISAPLHCTLEDACLKSLAPSPPGVPSWDGRPPSSRYQ